MSGLGALNLQLLRSAVDRMGGSDRLRVVFQSLYQRLSQDPMIGFFFDGKDLTAIAGKQQEFFERAIGLRETYQGKPPALAHRQMPPILEGHFNRRLVLLAEVLSQQGFEEAEIEGWIQFEEAFKRAIVQVKT